MVVVEKIGLVFGYMNVFYCLVEGYFECGLIFLMVSIMKLGSFDMVNICVMEILVIVFFLILLVLLIVFDVWEKMLLIV